MKRKIFESLTSINRYVILKKEMPDSSVISTSGKSRLVFRRGRLLFSTHYLFLKYERTAITVQIIVAIQVITATISSNVISKPPLSIISILADTRN